jgi:hypothetical protein
VNRYGISLTVFIGSMIGIFLVYPQASAVGLAMFGLLNGGFALLVCVVAVQVMTYFGLIEDHSQ